MPSSAALTPGLSSYLKSLKTNPIDTSIDNLISLLKRRQIRHSRSCATATAYLLLRVISACRTSDAGKLIERVQSVGRRLIAAQPREMVVGNIVRRVLGLIRDEAEDDREGDFTLSEAGSESQPQTPRATDDPSVHEGSDRSLSRPPFPTINTTPISMFNLLSHPEPQPSLPGTPVSASPSGRFPPYAPTKDIRAEVLEGIGEIIDELGQVDDQIAAYALDHIHSNEIILTHTSSTTVQRFLLKAAAKRKFTVIHAESYPNNHEATHATVSGKETGDEEIMSTESFQKPLIALGITVILIPDSAVFALMSRVNKVILGTHSVLANGGLVAAAGTRVIARAAKLHQTPVVVASGVYKLSPVYPFDFESLIEYGDASKVIPYEDGDLVDQLDVQNPLYDYVPAELVDLYITNLGGHAPSYLYRIVSDHYRKEDISF
ncbi:translation regulator GCD7 [Aspergillus campestris IBT 28561]|uniref:Translation initiation factor eIF2B subunit beta n=1 Tax=Aspergillus campestris (strain IBT 28561) TaxID=1392248 RepID=A0A2I1CTE7_ASPC2|nr:translation regulator GCD7 [Aspergillus campestris IBT 28561]PKY00885.1 translation regulator GCD7 [Aspergillus campestris IBT 28561]